MCDSVASVAQTYVSGVAKRSYSTPFIAHVGISTITCITYYNLHYLLYVEEMIHIYIKYISYQFKCGDAYCICNFVPVLADTGVVFYLHGHVSILSMKELARVAIAFAKMHTLLQPGI